MVIEECGMQATTGFYGLNKMKISIITETTGDLEHNEPQGYFEFEGVEYPYWGNPNGKMKTIDYDVGKFNRYAKMGIMADDLVENFTMLIKEDYTSVNARCAFACLVMMEYGIRIGNEDSATGYESGKEENEGEFVQTYGTTTLLNKHVFVDKSTIKLNFLGKTQVEQDIFIEDDFVVKYAKLYDDANKPEEKWLGIDYSLLFDFVKDQVGSAFVPKDFRTFCANVSCWKEIKKYLSKAKRSTKTEVNEEIKSIIERVANQLGNTPGIAKRNYVDGSMLDWFKNERLDEN